MKRIITIFFGALIAAIFAVIFRTIYKSTSRISRDKPITATSSYVSYPPEIDPTPKVGLFNSRLNKIWNRSKQYWQKPVIKHMAVTIFAILLGVAPIAESATLSCRREFGQVNCLLTYNLLVLIKISTTQIQGLYDVTFNHLQDRWGTNRGESVELETSGGPIRAGMISYSSTRSVRDQIEYFLSDSSATTLTITYYNPPVFYCLGLFIIGLLFSLIFLPRRHSAWTAS